MKRIAGRAVPVAVLFLCLASHTARSQSVTVGTNAFMWADFGTINAEASVAVGAKVSLHAGGRYNDWSFGGDEKGSLMNRKRAAWAGVRWWPWTVNSGWYLQGKVQWQEYNTRVLKSLDKEQGDAYGAGLAVGYAVMLSPRVNLELGVGAWGGVRDYGLFTKSEGGRYIEGGRRPFVFPDELTVTFTFLLGRNIRSRSDIEAYKDNKHSKLK